MLTIQDDKPGIRSADETHPPPAPHWVSEPDRTLPINERQAWDGRDAEQAVLHRAGWPDAPNAEQAKRAFLAYDAANPNEKGSYKLPFARVGADGELEAVRAGLQAAAQRLPQTDLPEEVKTEVESALKAYQDRHEPLRSGSTEEGAADRTKGEGAPDDDPASSHDAATAGAPVDAQKARRPPAPLPEKLKPPPEPHLTAPPPPVLPPLGPSPGWTRPATAPRTPGPANPKPIAKPPAAIHSTPHPSQDMTPAQQTRQNDLNELQRQLDEAQRNLEATQRDLQNAQANPAPVTNPGTRRARTPKAPAEAAWAPEPGPNMNASSRGWHPPIISPAQARQVAQQHADVMGPQNPAFYEQARVHWHERTPPEGQTFDEWLNADDPQAGPPSATDLRNQQRQQDDAARQQAAQQRAYQRQLELQQRALYGARGGRGAQGPVPLTPLGNAGPTMQPILPPPRLRTPRTAPRAPRRRRS